LKNFKEFFYKALVDGLVILEEQQYVLLLRTLVPSWKPFIASQSSNAY
jgi:hypothetical protein